MTFDATCISVGKRASSHRAFATVRTNGWTDDWTNGKGNAVARALGRTKDGTGRWVRWVAERLRRNYLLSCVFIFRVITNEVNRNRTKLILLSVEKSHRRLSVHPLPAIFPPSANGDAMRRDACVPLLHSRHRAAVCGVFDAGKENRTDSPLGRRIKIIPLISDFRILKTRARTAKRDKRKKLERNGEKYVKAVDGMSRYSLRRVTRSAGSNITAMKI